MANLFTTAESRIAAMRAESSRLLGARKEAVRRHQSRFAGVGGSFSTPFDSTATIQDDSALAKRQYEAMKDTPYTAIRPIANKGAEQPFRVGVDGNRASLDKTLEGRMFAKMAGPLGLDRQRADLAPGFICKDIGQTVTPLDSHPLLDLLANPNEMMTGYALKQCSFASMALTGRFVWWFDTSGEVRKDAPGLGNLRLWYVPRSWLTRPESRDFSQWKIRAPGMAGGITVSAGELFISTMHDPGNPFTPLSPLQSQAKAVDTEDKILRAQAVSMDNCMRPNLVVTVGRLPGMPGGNGRQGPRPILSGEQRGQIIDAIRLHHQSVARYGEPLILDGLIENVSPFLPRPQELDLLNSSKITTERIMQGLGVSPIIAGYAENANRAGSVVAKEIFYELALNPMIEMISQDADAILGPRFSSGGKRLRVWLEKAVADDPDAALARAKEFPEVMTLDEKREFVKTGKLNLAKLSDADRAELTQAAVQAVASQVPKEVVTGE